MANREQLLYWDGVLKGNGQEAVCTVEVLEVTNPAGGPHAYTQFTIINVARSLPDGLYDLEAHGHMHQVRHANGGWTVSSLDSPKPA
jgi:hypothetical protein